MTKPWHEMNDVPKIAFTVLIVPKELPEGAIDIGEEAIISFYSIIAEMWADNVYKLPGDLDNYKWAFIEKLI